MTEEKLPTCVVLIPLVEKSNGNGRLQDLYEKDLYEKVIKPEVEKAGFEPWSAVEASPDNWIIEQLRLEIMRSALVIADIRDNNPNVLYETGLAHAHRKPVVLIANSIDSVPLDLLPSRVLLYNPNDKETFRRNLEQRLRRYAREKN
jgi:hypothetical protein